MPDNKQPLITRLDSLSEEELITALQRTAESDVLYRSDRLEQIKELQDEADACIEAASERPPSAAEPVDPPPLSPSRERARELMKRLAPLHEAQLQRAWDVYPLTSPRKRRSKKK